MAQQFFQLVGASASECDTIPGRQCMASCFFLLKQFEDAADAITKRDAAIREASELYATRKAELRTRQTWASQRYLENALARESELNEEQKEAYAEHLARKAEQQKNRAKASASSSQP